MRRRYPPTTNETRLHTMNSSRSQATGRRFSMLAIEEEVQLPSRHGVVATRRLKILRLDEAPSKEDQPGAGRAQFRLRQTAPSAPVVRPRRELADPTSKPQVTECLRDGKHVGFRSVGEVVTDEAGTFYEVRGQQLRPLGELVRDECGKIFEVCHSSNEQQAERAKAGMNGAPTGPQAGEHPPAARGSTTEIEMDQQSVPKPNGKIARPGPTIAQVETQPGYRKVLADPGLYLEIPFARIKNEIAPQLKHPENLKDSDRIEFYAQIYEAQRTMAVAGIAAAELRDGGLHWQLHPLTRDKAEMLGVPQLFRPTRHPFETKASTRQLHAGQRIYRLRPVFDPTAERGTTSGGRPAASTEKALRAEIPPEYVNPLQFRYSREEVLYDMKGPFGTLPPDAGTLVRWFLIYPLRLLKVLGVAIASRGRMKKWRAVLERKSADEQLWTNTPPRSFSYNPAVRRWAEQTLILAGYDLKCMLFEWEIFWRRMGWK